MKYALVYFFISLSSTAWAVSNYQKAAQLLYPSSIGDQNFIIKFFEIVEKHKTQDPLMGRSGPSVAGFGLNKQPIALITNEREAYVDLIIINWTLPIFQELQRHREASEILGTKVYILKDIQKKSIATQGENNDELANYSYVNGANFMEKQLRVGNSNMVVPDEFLNWKPHPAYMDKTHPLRVALDGTTLMVLSPSEQIFFGFTNSPAVREAAKAIVNSQGGYLNTVLGNMVHEAFHLKENNDRILPNTPQRKVELDREALIDLLKVDFRLKKLLAAYVTTIFNIGDTLKKDNSLTEASLLADLQVIIKELKTKYPNAWNFIWDYEYTEGFAEYVSAQSMVAVGVVSLPQELDLQKADPSNNFAYRTGSIGGLYLYHRLGVMPFASGEDRTKSLWEIILDNHSLQKSNDDIDEIIARVKSLSWDASEEIERVIEYLIFSFQDFE